jgi:methylglutamate dehydrogenase subunit C
VEASSLGLWLYRELRTASHDWAVETSATFVDTGLWKRAQWFAKPSDRDWLDSVTREVTAVRTSVGVCDVSTLGKIDIHSPDAGIFLDRLYVNMFSTLAVGKARYGVMLREDGFVLDDGTTTRLADDHYFMTTTTANAVKIMQHVDYCRQVLWPELNVQAVSVTEQWAQFAIAEPNSRRLLQKVFPDLELSNDAFPYMSATGWVCRRESSGWLACVRGSRSGALRRRVGPHPDARRTRSRRGRIRHRSAWRASDRKGTPGRQRT